MQKNVSLHQLHDFANDFWKTVGSSKVFAFHGEMGAGKTTIITALCKAKGVKDVVGSPTFSIINEYVYHTNNSTQSLFHIDLYRLKDEQEIVQAGVEDCIYSGSICMVEWPEKAPNLFDEKTVHVFIKVIDDNIRNVMLQLPLVSMK